jgi:hypothetical protein
VNDETSSLAGKYDLLTRAIREIGSAQDETAVINSLISLSIEATRADGASYVPVDDNMQPIAVFREGDFPNQVTDNVLEYIATPTVRQQCRYCSNHEILIHDCPLLSSRLDSMQIFCIPLRCNGKFGYLNLYYSWIHGD